MWCLLRRGGALEAAAARLAGCVWVETLEADGPWVVRLWW